MNQADVRTVGVHLTHGGDYLGPVGPFEVGEPWWSSVGSVVERVSGEVGVPVAVVRLVAVTGGEGGRGGHPVYHVEALERPDGRAARPADAGTAALLGPAERRAGWATPQGLRAALDWAERALAAAGRPVTGRARQVRTWNLSGLFRLPTATGPVWLKAINPAFNAREAEAIALFGAADPALVPVVLAADPAEGRVLLDEVPGEDCWGPSEAAVADVVPRLVAAQAALAADGRAAAAGLRDRTPRALAAAVPGLLDRLAAGSELTAGELAAARALAGRLPALVEELAACGLPETVVHGDFHPGNWRSDGGGPVVLDFADACLGHPVADALRPRAFVSGERWAQLAGEWARAWRERVPGCAPERALELAPPLFHLGYALRYQEFLDHIEDSERPYHEGDPAAEVRRALEQAR
ncbi:aminoglycoside phosphotransferase family protein [Kitasatospora sp. NPDC058032]|uniref:aminoglycoside phosphotransferase family protein n=1 Tax=Kitasatospora sp. NPDC058032 TaxID=3346307 RepID=UPI0036D98728